MIRYLIDIKLFLEDFIKSILWYMDCFIVNIFSDWCKFLLMNDKFIYILC